MRSDGELSDLSSLSLAVIKRRERDVISIGPSIIRGETAFTPLGPPSCTAGSFHWLTAGVGSNIYLWGSPLQGSIAHRNAIACSSLPNRPLKCPIERV